MEIAHLRELHRQTNQCQLAFHLKIVDESGVVIVEDDLRSVRQISDSVKSLLSHTKNKILKLLEGKEENLELSLSLNKGDESIDDQITCFNLIKQFSRSTKKTKNLIFKVCKQSFTVMVNAPTIIMIELPRMLYVGYEIQIAKFKCIFTKKELCENIWFTSKDKMEWDEVCLDYTYTPTPKDLDKYIKLRCTPENDRMKGQQFEVVSETPVQNMSPIPRSPFEDRHEYTKNRLTGSQLRVVSYNILSNMYCNSNHFPYCTPETLSMDYRKQLILKELKGYNADIICLQECDHYIFDKYLKRQLTKDYLGVFNKKGNRIKEGLACLYCNKRFRLIQVLHLVYSDEIRTNALFKSTWRLLQQTRNLKDNILKHPTSLQLTVLKKNGTNDVVIVANTHLYYHLDASEVRLIQISLALDYISAIAKDYERSGTNSNVSVIFCGDFNSVPDSLAYSFVTNGMIQHTFEKDSVSPLSDVHLAHRFKLKSAYGTPKYTNYTQDFKGCLDYIFYDERKFNLVGCVPLPDESVLSEYIALPSKVFPTDHLALVTNLEMV